MNFYWAYGSIEDGAIVTPEPANQGTVALDLSPAQPSETPITPEEQQPPTTSEEQQPSTEIPEEKERPKPLRSESSASSLNAVFSVLFFIGVLLHLS
jgi:hypothetical protein